MSLYLGRGNREKKRKCQKQLDCDAVKLQIGSLQVTIFTIRRIHIRVYRMILSYSLFNFLLVLFTNFFIIESMFWKHNQGFLVLDSKLL